MAPGRTALVQRTSPAYFISHALWRRLIVACPDNVHTEPIPGNYLFIDPHCLGRPLVRGFTELLLSTGSSGGGFSPGRWGPIAL